MNALSCPRIVRVCRRVPRVAVADPTRPINLMHGAIDDVVR